MQTIYIDVLIVLNIYVNYFLIRATGKITHTQVKFPRCIGASVYGSLFSLIILVPQLNPTANIAIKLAAAATIVPMAFGFYGKMRFFLNCAAFFTVNFIFAGAIYAVYSWLKPGFMHFSNSVVYIDFSLILLVVSTAGLYLAVCGVRYFLDRTPDNADCYKIIIRYRDRIVSLSGLADTGNSLVDFFSGSPVIICSRGIIADITGHKTFQPDTSDLPKGFRLIPCSTVCSGGLIPVFRPDEVVILDARSGLRKSVEAMVGFAAENPSAIFNPKLLRL